MDGTGSALLAALLACAGGGGDDVVKLRNGRIVVGSVSIGETAKESVLVRPWDSDSSLVLRWDQLAAGEQGRLLAATAPARPNAEKVDGIRVITFSRIVEGVLIREEADRLLIKTSEARAPVAVPKGGLAGRADHVALPEEVAYTAEERIERRAARLKADDDEGLLDLAGLASRWGLPAKAKEFCRRAEALKPSRTEEIEARLAAWEALARDRQAAALLEDIGRLAKKAEFPRALELARTLLADWPETSAARESKDLVSRLEAGAREWKDKKGDVLARLVPEAYRQKLTERIAQASRLTPFAEARAAVGEFDARVVEDLARDFKSAPDEIRVAWDRRERRIRTVGFASGSWVILGGQEGGLDSDAKFIPVHRNLAKPPPPPVDLGVKLDTAQDWWAKAGTYERRDWLEAEYARTSAVLQRTFKERHCSRCVGEGALPARRMAIDVSAKCPRCHGVKTDRSVEYQ
jgi:hypothetical protein